MPRHISPTSYQSDFASELLGVYTQLNAGSGNHCVPLSGRYKCAGGTALESVEMSASGNPLGPQPGVKPSKDMCNLNTSSSWDLQGMNRDPI